MKMMFPLVFLRSGTASLAMTKEAVTLRWKTPWNLSVGISASGMLSNLAALLTRTSNPAVQLKLNKRVPRAAKHE